MKVTLAPGAETMPLGKQAVTFMESVRVNLQPPMPAKHITVAVQLLIDVFTESSAQFTTPRVQPLPASAVPGAQVDVMSRAKADTESA